jgi:sialic acid synthase SpsE
MVYVVAEIGVNWDGDFTLAKTMMSKSKEAGCNAVKFQSFNESILGDHPQKKRLMSSSISKNNIEKINEMAKSVDIEWFCTPMYLEAVDLLDSLVQKFKVRVYDGRPILKNETSPLFSRILKTNKEIIISSEVSPVKTKFFGSSNIKWLYCVPKYPCEFSDLDFSNINDFNGYSNHCPHFLAPLTAAILGAQIIEVHVTSDKSKDFIDNDVSFDFDQLQEMVKLIRLSEKIKR